MKKGALSISAVMLVFFFCVSVHAGPQIVPGIYDDVTTKFWKEKFLGGGPGQPGNVLMAVGRGFMFQNAVLESVVPTGNADEYFTTYTGGRLTLNSKGPWLEKGNLKAKGVTVQNISRFDNDTGYLEFTLTMSGSFDRVPDSYFDITATYAGYPRIQIDGDGIWLFQRGRGADIDVVIDIGIAEE